LQLFHYYQQNFYSGDICLFSFCYEFDKDTPLLRSSNEAATILSIGSLLMILFVDDEKNDTTFFYLKGFLSAHVTNVLYASSLYILNEDSFAAPTLVSSILSFVFAVCATYFNPPTPQENPPTREFECGLLEYISFSYMNKRLIQPGLHKGTLEITDVPLLMDADSSAIIYK